MRKVLLFRGDERRGLSTEYIFVMPTRPVSRTRPLNIAARSAMGTRLRGYQSAITGFRCDGIGHELSILSTPDSITYPILRMVESVTSGEMNSEGFITWGETLERRSDDPD